MALLDRVKAAIFGSDDNAARRVPADDNNDDARETYEARQVRHPNVSSPADDPVLEDPAAAGVQAVSKPHEIEAAQNPDRNPQGLSR